jgi:hypothetical protein
VIGIGQLNSYNLEKKLAVLLVVVELFGTMDKILVRFGIDWILNWEKLEV